MRAFLTRLAAKETIVAVEAMTGWRFIAEECIRAGLQVRLAELAETRMRQDRKRRAKTDKLSTMPPTPPKGSKRMTIDPHERPGVAV